MDNTICIEKGYNPAYSNKPFIDFDSVNPNTKIKSLNFNWTEKDLPERVRTKHVHRLHPYLGKFIPQLVEIFLRKYQPKIVCDPFCGSGTTLVEANTLGIDAIGCDISLFNCLLSKIKTDKYDLKKVKLELLDILEKVNLKMSPIFSEEFIDTNNEYLRQWFADLARKALLIYKGLIQNYEYQDIMKIILSRSARSARLTTHFDLDFPKKPQTKPYECYKHDRICQPTEDALQFLNRYTLDTLKRIKEYSKIRTHARVQIFCGDSRTLDFPVIDAVITSPPYVGLIDYHEQHRYAYELLALKDNRDFEIGAASNGNSQKAKEAYQNDITKVFANVKKSLKKNGVMVVVVHDKNKLYDEIPKKLGLIVEDKILRHVNRRTGRRAGDFFEEILIWRNRD